MKNPDFSFAYKGHDVTIYRYKDSFDHFDLWIDKEFHGIRVLTKGSHATSPNPEQDARDYMDSTYYSASTEKIGKEDDTKFY
jgi:hypothetical protein